MRCLIVARELKRVAPQIESRFLISRDAYFRDSIEFGVDECDASPTLCTPQVLAVLERFRPDVVVFDNAGRTRQMKAAHARGARIVFISRAPRLRRKAFRFRWLRYLSEHWIVFPAFITGALTLRERLKLKLYPQVAVRYLDAVFQPPDPTSREALRQRLGLTDESFVLFIPGSGGTHPDAVKAVELFTEAARRFSAATGARSLVLTGSNVMNDVQREGLLSLLPRLHSDEVQHLIHDASMVVSNAGNSMLHTLAQRKCAVIVPMGGDQPRRIRKAVAAGVALACAADAQQIANRAQQLYRDNTVQRTLQAQLGKLGLTNGLSVAVDSLQRLARNQRSGTEISE